MHKKVITRYNKQVWAGLGGGVLVMGVIAGGVAFVLSEANDASVHAAGVASESIENLPASYEEQAKEACEGKEGNDLTKCHAGVPQVVADATADYAAKTAAALEAFQDQVESQADGALAVLALLAIGAGGLSKSFFDNARDANSMRSRLNSIVDLRSWQAEDVESTLPVDLAELFTKHRKAIAKAESDEARKQASCELEEKIKTLLGSPGKDIQEDFLKLLGKG